ncbi:amidohydrolase family protein [Amedibacillus sp. YH-ame10]
MIDIHSHINLLDGELDFDELLTDMDRYSIDKRVISYLAYDEIQKYNHLIADAIKKYPDRFVGCAIINPCLCTALEDIKDALSMPYIKMIEFNSFEHGYYPDHCATLDSIFEEINKHKLPVKIFSGLGAKSLPQQWVRYVEKYPDINFIFLHMGCFDYGYGCIDMVKKYPNALVETSNQYELQILRKAFEQLPSQKILFGSCYPERLTRSAIEVFELFDIKEDDLYKIQHENAQSLLQRGS